MRKIILGGVLGMIAMLTALIVVTPAFAGCENLADGRINDDAARSCAAPVIIYDDPLTIYAVDAANNTVVLALEVSDEEIKDAGIPEEGYVTIAEGTNPVSGKPIAVYRLSDGEFQVNTFYANDEGYVVVWTEDGDHYAYTFYLPE